MRNWIAEIQGQRRLFALGALIIAFAAAVAGCQNGSPARTAGQSVTPADADADSLWWIGELHSLQKQYLQTVSFNCHSAGSFGHEQCMKAKMLESLSPNGEAGKNCPQDEIMGLFIACVDRLTTAERAYVALGLDPAQDMNWTDPSRSLADVSRLIGLRLTSKCRSSLQRDCLAREISYMFAVNLMEADRCAALGTIAQVQCAIGLSMMEKFRSAMLYVG